MISVPTAALMLAGFVLTNAIYPTVRLWMTERAIRADRRQWARKQLRYSGDTPRVGHYWRMVESYAR